MLLLIRLYAMEWGAYVQPAFSYMLVASVFLFLHIEVPT